MKVAYVYNHYDKMINLTKNVAEIVIVCTASKTQLDKRPRAKAEIQLQACFVLSQTYSTLLMESEIEFLDWSNMEYNQTNRRTSPFTSTKSQN